MYDTYDILRSNKKLSAQSKEVLLHHALVSEPKKTFCFYNYSK